LRTPRRSDCEAIAELANDRRIAENTARLPHPYGLADAESFVARAKEDENERCFVVTLADGRLIGACGLARFDRKAPEIGYWIGVPFWGQGYATEAARAVIDHVFSASDYETIHGAARISNPASRRVLEKCGFQWAGVELRRIRAIASVAPVDCFRLDRRLWSSLKAWGRAYPPLPPARSLRT
jgi:RimJ/RimL family protein N-acetyltransferase